MAGVADPSSHAMRPATGIAVMVIGMVILASTDAVSKHLTLAFAVVQILWVRYVIFAGMGTVMAWRHAGLDGFKSRRPGLQILRALVMNAANFIFVFSLSLMGLADANSIMAIAPLMVTAVSAPLLGETVGPRRWIAVGVGFTGVLIILRPGAGVFDPTALIPLAGAVCFTAYTLLTKVLSRHDANETTLFYTGWVGFLSLSVVIPFFWTQPGAVDWFWLIVAGIGGTLAHVCIIGALHLAPANTLQPFNYIMLAWTAVLGFLVFDNLSDLWTTVGAIVIVMSGLYAWHRDRIAAREG